MLSAILLVTMLSGLFVSASTVHTVNHTVNQGGGLITVYQGKSDMTPVESYIRGSLEFETIHIDPPTVRSYVVLTVKGTGLLQFDYINVDAYQTSVAGYKTFTFDPVKYLFQFNIAGFYYEEGNYYD